MKVSIICTDNDYWCFGARRLSAVLRRAGHSTQLILLPSDDEEYSQEVLDQTREHVRSAGLIGFSCFSRGSRKTRQLAGSLRDLDTPMIWGGIHATLNPAQCAEAVDMVCRGEGEETIVEVAGALDQGQGWEHIRNLAYSRAGVLIANPVRPPFRHMDDLPFYDFERRDEYQLTRGGLTHLPAEDLQPRQVQFIGSSGCAFRCTYCSNRRLREVYAGNGVYLRRISPARYVEHLENLCKERFPNATDLFLLDEDFFQRPLAEVCEFAELYKCRIGLPFDCLASAPRITAEKLRPLVEAGLWRISIGVESGSERTKREVYDRPISNESLRKASRLIAEHRGLTPCYFVIIGNPYEEREDLLETVRLMMELPVPYRAHMYSLVFFPGSELYDRAVREGVISGAGDSGCDIDYRGGYRIERHAWKQRNAYLNSLLFLTEGNATKRRQGLVPRFLVPLLVHPWVISFMDGRRVFCRIVIGAKVGLRPLRVKVGGLLRKLVRNPAERHNLPLLVKSAVRRVLGAAGPA